MMEERGLSMVHITIMRWVHQYGPQLDKRVRRHLKPTNDSWRVDETYIKVKGQWMYLYRAVDSEGNTIDFYLSKTRDKKAMAENHATNKISAIIDQLKEFLKFNTLTSEMLLRFVDKIEVTENKVVKIYYKFA
jgi:DDE domain/Domain of unknown function (DUF4368)